MIATILFSGVAAAYAYTTTKTKRKEDRMAAWRRGKKRSTKPKSKRV